MIEQFLFKHRKNCVNFGSYLIQNTFEETSWSKSANAFATAFSATSMDFLGIRMALRTFKWVIRCRHLTLLNVGGVFSNQECIFIWPQD